MNKNRDPRAFVARKATTILVVAGLAFLGIGVYCIHTSQQDFGDIGQDLSEGLARIQNVFRNQILALAGVFGGAILILGALIHEGRTESDSKMESRLRSSADQIERELQKRISVHETSSADHIWLNSTRMLDDLSEKGYRERHAYDVTTYFNRVRYEEMVAKCVAQGVIFQRVFCFRVQNKRPSDELMEWYLRSIESGSEVTLNELSKQSYKGDLLLAFKEHEGDECASELTAAHMERLNKVIDAQREAMQEGNLTITTLPRRMPMDFVVIDYVAEEGGSQEYEVQANFKTALQKETYVAGTYGKGAFARHYQQLFVDIIKQGVV